MSQLPKKCISVAMDQQRKMREFIQAMVEGELDAALMRPRYGRGSQSSNSDAGGPVGVTGHRHGHRSRSLMGIGAGPAPQAKFIDGTLTAGPSFVPIAEHCIR
jgi:hypothetical protein